MTKKSMLVDDNVEDIRRVRREMSLQFKSDDEFLKFIGKIEAKGKRQRAAKKTRNATAPKSPNSKLRRKAI